MPTWKHIPTPPGPAARYPNLSGALRSALLALRRHATAEEWTDFVSNAGQVRYNPGKLREWIAELEQTLKEVEGA
jgi:hypothetical protein